MTDRGGRWSGAPIRGVEPAVDHADPTGGRHAFDQDAALTPIFTTLRRGGWRRHRPQSGPSSHCPQATSSAHRAQSASRPLRPVPDAPTRFRNDAVTRFRDDPLTAPLPVVPAAYLVGDDPADGPPPVTGYGVRPIDPYAPGSFALPSPSPSEVTTWWRSPLADPSDRGIERLGYGGAPGQDPAYHPASYVSEFPAQAVYEAAGNEPGAYDAAYDPTAYDAQAYDTQGYDAQGYDAHGYDAHGYDAGAGDSQVYYDAPYGDAGYHEAGYHEAGYHEAGYHEAGYHEAGYHEAGYDEAGYDEPAPYDIPRHRRFSDPMSYDAVADSGRHHRRLAPAGW